MEGWDGGGPDPTAHQSPNGSYHTDAITGQVLWPPEILAKARAAVVSYQYVGGCDEDILAGKFDHWHAVQVACYAVAGISQVSAHQAIKQLGPKQKKADFADRVAAVEQEFKRRDTEQRKRVASILAAVEQTTTDNLRGYK